MARTRVDRCGMAGRIGAWASWIALVAAHAGSAPSRADGLPVVFVPGTAGSRLVEPVPGGKVKRFWISPGLMKDGAIDKAALGPGGQTPLSADDLLRGLKLTLSVDLTIDAPIGPDDGGTLVPDDAYQTRNLVTMHRLPYPVYGDFVEWARTKWLADPALWHEVPYDWRKGACEENARAIGVQVDQALRASGQSQVVLLAHSLGGLVCRDYIRRGDNARKVRALIAVGTPWLGAPKSARGLRWGYHFGLGRRLDPSGESITKGIYIFYRDRDGRQKEVPYFTLVSLLDLRRTRAVAVTFPCVYQQLPAPEFMEIYGAALPWKSPTSVFLGEDPGATIESFRVAGRESKARVGRDLYEDALALRREALDGKAYGVRHFLIAATCDPGIAPDLAMVMRMAGEGDPSLEWVSDEKFTRFQELARLGRWWDSFQKARFRLDRETRDAFFEISPTLRAMGNFNWHLLRREALRRLREEKGLPIYSDPVIAVDTDVRWGDGTAPLLSATAGAQARDDLPKDDRAAARWLGEGTVVAVCRLGKNAEGEFNEHSSMLDDAAVQALIRAKYDEASRGASR